MNNPRRKFIITAGLAAGTVAVSGLQTLAASPSSADTGKQEVRKLLSKYGVAREGRYRSKVVKFEVKMHSHEAFAKVFVGERAVPIEKIYAEGNTMRFEHKGTSFVVNNIA